MVQAILVDGKISCSTIPNLFWNILLVWSTSGDLNDEAVLDLPVGPLSGFVGLGLDSRRCIQTFV